ncbi:MAG: hypothetical protein ACJ786_06605 [Catenulispora sp.]
MRRRLVTVTAGALGLIALSTGMANASAIPAAYRGQYSIPFTTLSACAASSAARNDPPDLYSYPCETVVIGGVTEWRYWYKYLIS